MKRTLSLAVLTILTAGLLLLGGCSDANSLAPASRMAEASITIKWPDRDRLIPLMAESIKVELVGQKGFTETQVVNRPTTGNTTTVTFQKVPSGATTMTATAYPEAGAGGVAQATGASTATAVAGTPLHMVVTMASTITRITMAVTGADTFNAPFIEAGDEFTCIATARNAADEIVLVAADAFTWSSDPAAVIAIDAATGQATPLQGPETCTISVTEKESGATSTLTLQVLPATTGTVTVSVAWPDRDRVIPQAANSIRFDLAGADGFAASMIVNRPADGSASTLSFPRVPAGDATLTATAYPNFSGAGTPLAAGAQSLVIIAGQVAQPAFTMNSTISRLAISTSPATVAIGDTFQCTATAYDANGHTVLLHPGGVDWSSSDDGVASIDANGAGVAMGTGPVVIAATARESGVAATLAMNVDTRGFPLLNSTL